MYISSVPWRTAIGRCSYLHEILALPTVERVQPFLGIQAYMVFKQNFWKMMMEKEFVRHLSPEMQWNHQKERSLDHVQTRLSSATLYVVVFHNWEILFPLIAIIFYSTEINSWERLCISGPNLMSILSPDLSVYRVGICTFLCVW